MHVLALDTSSRTISVALCRADLVCARRSLEGPPAERLLGLVDEVLAEAGVAREAIDLIAVGVGPGLFTGTRIGVATAKGLALALDRPLVGVSSLLAIARTAGVDAVSIDAGRGEVYAAAFEPDIAPFLASAPDAMARLEGRRRVASASLGEPTESGHVRLPLGDGVLELPVAPAPDASWIAREGAARFVRDGRDERATLEPDYVRASDAKLPSKG